MNDDAALLRRYAATGAQDAFAELVRGHLRLVYQAALRHSSGDAHRAEEIAQIVFTEVARKSGDLSRHPLLVAWLHTTTRHIALRLRRAEARRLAREHAAFAMNADELGGGFGTDAGVTAPEPAAEWERLRPFIDEALESLGDRDRAAVLLRFFENRSYAEVAAALSVSDDAARVRVNRALEKLRATLARRGLVSTATALGLALAQPALAATPPGLAASVITVSLTAATTTTAVVMSTAKIAALVTGAVAALSLGFAFSSPPRPAQASVPSSPVSTASAPASANLPGTPQPASARPTTTASRTLKIPPRLQAAEAADALALYLALPPLPDQADATAFNARAAQLRGLLTILPSDAFTRLLDALATREGQTENRLRGLAFEVWTEREAPVAARWADALAPSPALDAGTRLAYLRQAAVAWAAQDFDAAFAWTESRPDPADLGDLARALILALASTDGPRALSLARARGGDFFQTNEVRLVLNWSDRDPAAAMRTLGSVAMAERRFGYPYDFALSLWFGKNPAAALDWLFAQPPPVTSLDQFKFDTLVTSGPALNIPDPGVVATALLGRPEQSKYLPLLLRNWLTRSPDAALAWLDTLADASLRAELLEFGSGQLAIQTSSPERYLPILVRLPPGEDRDEKITRALGALAERSPDAAHAWMQAHDTPEFAGVAARVNGQLISGLAAADPAAALARWQALPEGTAKEKIACDLAQNWAKTDPAAAARWFGDQLPATPSDLDQNILTTLTISLMRSQPGVQVRPNDETETELARKLTLTATTRAWAQRDPLAALHWATSLPDPARRQIAITIVSVADERPLPAQADLLVQIQDSEVRVQSLNELFSHWLQNDPPTARAWLDTHDALSPEQIATLLAQAEKNATRATSIPSPK